VAEDRTAQDQPSGLCGQGGQGRQVTGCGGSEGRLDVLQPRRRHGAPVGQGGQAEPGGDRQACARQFAELGRFAADLRQHVLTEQLQRKNQFSPGRAHGSAAG
jgi:ABC-type uncharacterized transport system permease subunit